MSKHVIFQQLDALELDNNDLAIVWLGQNGFLIKHKLTTFLFDPYLSEFAEQWTDGWPNQHVRMSAIPIHPKDVLGTDYVFCSHDHVDHIDPFTIPILALRNPDSLFIAPQAAKQRMQSLFVSKKQLYTLRGLDSQVFKHLTVHAIPAAHSKLDYSHEYGYPYLSYILEIGDLTLFFAGDTIPYSEQVDYVKPYKIDLAFLPINGQKAPELDLEPNFSIVQAIEFAKAIEAKTVMPMHYNMFTINTVDINDFVIQAKGNINYQLPQIGIPVLFRKDK